MGRWLRGAVPWLGAIVLGIGAGCGGTVDREVASELDWRSEEELRRSEVWPGGVTSPHREVAGLDLPQAGNAGLDLETGWSRPLDPRSSAVPRVLCVNEQADRTVYVRGHSWPWNPARRAETAALVRKQVSEATQRTPDAGAMSTAAEYLVLRLDRRATTEEALDLLAIANEFRVAMPVVRLAVTNRTAARSWTDAQIQLTWSDARGDAESRYRVRLEMGKDGIVSLDSRGRSVFFAPGGLYAAETLRTANRIWAALRAAIASVRVQGPTRLEMAVDDPVPWAYAVQTMAVSLDAGVTEVRLEESENGTAGRVMSFALSTSPVHVLPEFGARDSRDWSPLLAVAIGVGAALLVFGRGLLRSLRLAPRRG